MTPAPLAPGGRGPSAGPFRGLISLLRWLLAASPAFAGAFAAPSPPALVREHQIKAVFLFNFAQFVDWPASAFPADDSPLVIAVLGDAPFGTILEETVRGEKAGGHPLEVRRFTPPGAMPACHILFISRSEAARLDSLSAAVQDRGVLTVTDADSPRRGAMIRFITQQSRIRLRIDLDLTKRSGLTLSSKLLRAAETVGGGQ